MATSGITGSGSDRSQQGSSPYQRPSYFDFSSTAGLHPPEHTFDEGVIKKLDLDDTSCSESTGNMSADDERLKTFLRIRPSSLKKGAPDAGSSLEIKDSQTVVAFTDRKHFMPGNSKKQFEFKFSKVLGPTCGQNVVYEECVFPVVQRFMRHENVLIFSYGATNSGKTYTMQGSGVDYGIIPRTLDAIFARVSDKQYTAGNIRPHLYQAFHYLNPQEVVSLKEKRLKIISEANIKQELMNSYRLTASGFSDTSANSVHMIGGENFSEHSNLFSNTTVYSLWVSYAELYNERVYDLLDNASIGKNKRRKELKLMHDRNGFVYIKDLTELPVTSDEQAYNLFLAGRKNLQFAATQMNQNSSRSHSFFTIRVVSIGVEGGVAYPKTVHRMTFCDLAGMERANQTENTGFRLQESGNINNSLTVLLKVIRVLREKQLNSNGGVLETIPFRESKLTHIFKSFFTSSTHICMMVNVNPHPIVAESTIQVLQNSAVASNVVVFRPLDLNQQSHPPEVHGKPVAAKPPVPPAQTKKDTWSTTSSEKSASTNEESESDDDDYCLETVIAPKTMFQKLKILETENARLRRMVLKLEQENTTIREEAIKMIEEERITWGKRLKDAVAIEKNYINRRMSLQNQMSPSVVARCGKCSPSVSMIEMEDIDETDEDPEETEEETSESSESEDEKGDSDKEN